MRLMFYVNLATLGKAHSAQHLVRTQWETATECDKIRISRCVESPQRNNTKNEKWPLWRWLRGLKLKTNPHRNGKEKWKEVLGLFTAPKNAMTLFTQTHRKANSSPKDNTKGDRAQSQKEEKRGLYVRGW